MLQDIGGTTQFKNAKKPRQGLTLWTMSFFLAPRGLIRMKQAKHHVNPRQLVTSLMSPGKKELLNATAEPTKIKQAKSHVSHRRRVITIHQEERPDQ